MPSSALSTLGAGGVFSTVSPVVTRAPCNNARAFGTCPSADHRKRRGYFLVGGSLTHPRLHCIVNTAFARCRWARWTAVLPWLTLQPALVLSDSQVDSCPCLGMCGLGPCVSIDWTGTRAESRGGVYALDKEVLRKVRRCAQARARVPQQYFPAHAELRFQGERTARGRGGWLCTLTMGHTREVLRVYDSITAVVLAYV